MAIEVGVGDVVQIIEGPHQGVIGYVDAVRSEFPAKSCTIHSIGADAKFDSQVFVAHGIPMRHVTKIGRAGMKLDGTLLDATPA